MKHKSWKFTTYVALLLSLLFVSCKKDEEKRKTPTVDPVLIETIQLDFTQALAAEWHGKWVYCGRILDPSYFLKEDLPQELRDADFLIDITKAPLESSDKWSNERLRTIYKMLFEHAKNNAELLKKEASASEHSFSIPSYLTPLYLREGVQVLKVPAELKEGNKLRCSVYDKNISLEFRPNQIVIADTQPFRWIVLKRIS